MELLEQRAVGVLDARRRSPPGRDCRGRRRRCRRRSSTRSGRPLRLGAGAAARHEVEDAQAALALDQLLVAAHFVEDLGPQPDVAHGADAVARFGDREALALLATTCSNSFERLGGELPRPASARAAIVSSSSFCSAPRSASSAFCSARDSPPAAASAPPPRAFSSRRASRLLPCARGAVLVGLGSSSSAVAISCCIAWYSLLVFTSMSCPCI